MMKRIDCENRAEFNFVWLFAIIAGITILVLAIYGATKIGDTSRLRTDTEIAKKIAIITDPLLAGFAEGSFGKIEFASETRINNFCDAEGFGKNDISVATRSRVGEEWALAGGATSIHNKYIFSAERNQGTDYYVFSKGFEFPFKISDLIFLTSEDYCFVDVPKELEGGVLGLGINSVRMDNCTELESEKKVCFGSSSNCESNDIIVYGSCMNNCGKRGSYAFGSVMKYGEKFEYVDNLMYAAIFSDKEVYECNIKRLMYRLTKVSEQFINKADLMNARGCNTYLQQDVNMLASLAMNASSDDLISLYNYVKQVDVKNDKELCGLW